MAVKMKSLENTWYCVRDLMKPEEGERVYILHCCRHVCLRDVNRYASVHNVHNTCVSVVYMKRDMLACVCNSGDKSVEGLQTLPAGTNSRTSQHRWLGGEWSRKRNYDA